MISKGVQHADVESRRDEEKDGGNIAEVIKNSPDMEIDTARTGI